MQIKSFLFFPLLLDFCTDRCPKDFSGSFQRDGNTLTKRKVSWNPVSYMFRISLHVTWIGIIFRHHSNRSGNGASIWKKKTYIMHLLRARHSAMCQVKDTKMNKLVHHSSSHLMFFHDWITCIYSLISKHFLCSYCIYHVCETKWYPGFSFKSSKKYKWAMGCMCSHREKEDGLGKAFPRNWHVGWGLKDE